jgi:signal transduction histidine kinase
MELFFITLIILAQVYFFYLTLGKIKLLQDIFKDPVQYKVIRLNLLCSDLENVAPTQILGKYAEYEKKAAECTEEPSVTVALLSSYDQNPVGSKIIYTINTYLLRNSGATPDFNLVRDIAERNSDAVEGGINSTISIPLYLGLLGTLLGIVFGLSHISGLSVHGGESSSAMLDQAIPVLLGGVKVAMIASFTGLLLTIVHSGVFYRQAKAANDSKKNEFFSFLQIELLPLLSHNINEALYSLQTNLLTFNREFGHNIQRLDGLMNRNYEALKAQEQFMETLSKMDIMEFAAANVKVLNSLKTAVRSFSDFNDYVGAVNMALHKTDSIIVRLNEMMDRTDNLSQLTTKLTEVFGQNQELMEFIKSHFAALDSSKQLIGHAVLNVSEYLSQAIEELKYFTEEKIKAVRTIEVNESNLMQDSYTERWKNLDELKKMNQIVNALVELKDSNVQDRVAIKETFDTVSRAVTQLENGITVKVKWPAIINKLKNRFRKDKIYEEA